MDVSKAVGVDVGRRFKVRVGRGSGSGLGKTIPHPVQGRYGATRTFLRPAAPGTGVTAGPAVRAVLEAAGVADILTKNYGSTNPVNVVRATMDGLFQLRLQSQVEALRGVTL